MNLADISILPLLIAAFYCIQNISFVILELYIGSY